MARQIAYPFRVDARGRTAGADEESHVRQLIEQLLFTAPGERVNRPEFGTGLHQLVFAPNSDQLATATEHLIRGALQQWLGDVIQIEQIEVANEESSLRITVQYVLQRSGERRQVTLEREI